MQQHVKILLVLLFLIGGNDVTLIMKQQRIILASIFPFSFIRRLFSSILTIASSPTPNAAGSFSWSDPTIIAAIIGLGGILLGTVVALGTTIYQTHRSERLQRDLARRNEQQQRDIIRLQEDLKYEHERQERKEHDEQAIEAAEIKRQQMLRASTDEERAQLYRDALQADPRISTIKILDMERPLETINVYVSLRVHQKSQLTYRQESLFTQSAPIHDPNIVFQTDRKMREQRSSTALDPEKAISTYTRCVLLGDPGAGKTTLLRYLALAIAKRSLPELTDFLPVYIELNAFANSEFSDLLDYCARTWDDLYAFPYEEARRYIADQLYAGKAHLLLDALDETMVETSRENAYASVSQAILQVVTRYPRARLVVTARKAGYRQHAPLAGFTELDVLDFREKDIHQFIVNWYTCSHDVQKDWKIADLTHRLEQNAHLQALATNPLLLSLIVMVYDAQLDLPDRRADLYKQCVDILLTKWDARRNIRRRRRFQPEHKRQMLTIIAWHFHVQGQRYFEERELLQVIADFLPAIGLPKEENQLILQEIENNQGLLREQAQGWHGFAHLTLQEYFAALAVTDDEHFQILLGQRANPWWEEVLLLYAGSVPDASPLLQALIGQGGTQGLREDIFATNIVQAGYCLGTQPIVHQVALREQVEIRLFDLLVHTKYALLQWRIAQALAATRQSSVGRKLIHLLTDEHLDPGVKRNIAGTLRNLREKSVASELVHLLTDEHLDPDVRGNIAGALGNLGEKSVALELAQLLTDEHINIGVRWSIAIALGNLGEKSVIPELVHLLTDEHIIPSVRREIADALGNLGEKSVAPELVHLLTDEHISVSVRWSIAIALGNLGEKSVAPELVHLLTDEHINIGVRWPIAIALGNLGEKSVMPKLVHLLTDEYLDIDMRGDIVNNAGDLTHF